MLDKKNMYYENQGDWTNHYCIWEKLGLTPFNPNSVTVLKKMTKGPEISCIYPQHERLWLGPQVDLG